MSYKLSATSLTLILGFTLAGPLAASTTPEAVTLTKPAKAERYQVKTSKSRIKAGAARVLVRAPISVVRGVVTDYGNYESAISKFKNTRVLGHNGDTVDVYLQVPIMKGVSKVWAIVRFSAPKKLANGDEEIVGEMVKGNVDHLDARWLLTRIDDNNTKLDLELLIVPKLPLPGSLVSDEAAYAADKAVTGLQKRSESLHTKTL
jgi:ribosome-associated toxin RatA of RatAB toxin-antitoxin module